MSPILGILASANKPKAEVTGGTLYTSGGYNYRVFTANGTLGVTKAALTCDILVIAGGGGAGGGSGGNSGGSGGGAGGLVYFASESLAINNHSVTVGAGGGGGDAANGSVGDKLRVKSNRL